MDGGGSNDGDDDNNGHSLSIECLTDNMLRDLHRPFKLFKAHIRWVRYCG